MIHSSTICGTSFASLLIQQDETLMGDQLGHASIQMTVGVYGHVVPGGIARPSIASMTRR